MTQSKNLHLSNNRTQRFFVLLFCSVFLLTSVLLRKSLTRTIKLHYYMRNESLIIPKFIKRKLWIDCLVSLFSCFLDIALDFKFILIIKLIKRFTFAVRIARYNLGIERVLIDYKKYLSRATDEDGIVFFSKSTRGRQ